MASEFKYTIGDIRELEWDYVVVLIKFLERKYSPQTSSTKLRGYDTAAINKLKGMSTRKI